MLVLLLSNDTIIVRSLGCRNVVIACRETAAVPSSNILAIVLVQSVYNGYCHERASIRLHTLFRATTVETAVFDKHSSIYYDYGHVNSITTTPVHKHLWTYMVLYHGLHHVAAAYCTILGYMVAYANNHDLYFADMELITQLQAG